MREKRSLVESYRKRNRLTFPHLLDSENAASGAYGVRYTPTTFVVNKKGHVVARGVGPKPWASPEFQKLFKEMISEK